MTASGLGGYPLAIRRGPSSFPSRSESRERFPPPASGDAAQSIPALIHPLRNGVILSIDPAAWGGPWIRPRSALALRLSQGVWCGGVWSSGAEPVSLVLRDGDAPWTGEGRGRRDVFRLSCLRRLQACPSGDGTGRTLDNGPLPASPEPSKEGENAPRGASVPAPKRTSARFPPHGPPGAGPALRRLPA